MRSCQIHVSNVIETNEIFPLFVCLRMLDGGNGV